jgi:CHASE2 domain-containing sensor protein
MKKRPPVSTLIAQPSNRSQQRDTATGKGGWLKRKDWGRAWVAAWAIAATATTALNLGLVQLFERQAQTLFFEMRGVVAPPKEIVILAIDEESLAQGEFFRADPQQHPELAPIESWPWQRTVYATVIDKLMAAGAKAVAIDILFSNPSSYGEADDQQFAQALQKYAGRVVLAAQYAEVETPQGYTTQLTTPLPQLCDVQSCVGSINFLLEPDGRIHQLAEQFLPQLLQNSPPAQAEVLPQIPTFTRSTLQAARVSYPTPTGSSIFFYGPPRTFTHIPFWHVLNSDNWESYLQSGAYFKDKIVLIGSTATSHQDLQPAPFSKTWFYPDPMAGVEIHANAIASLLEGRTIAEIIPQAPLRGLFVFIGVVGAGWLICRPQRPLRRLGWAITLGIIWLGVSYGLFVRGNLIIPTAVPVGAIVLSGFSQLIIGSAKEQVSKQQLRDTLKQYVTSPIVQEIISQQEDLQDLLRERELALSGTILGGRYRITRVLGAGGFSETYIAEDLQRPGKPECVVKQLRVVTNNLKTLKLAQRLFETEAETLERLGQHDQIPQLLASFEEKHEFYLVQELVQGHPLSRELSPHRTVSEPKVLQMLWDILDVLAFVHSEGVIHRDIKPSNIIRRQPDGKLVLIDFGVAKKITTQLAETSGQSQFTVSVGTPGYMPGEQSAGRPQFNSDIYALGMVALQALTGQSPHHLNHDAATGAVIWRNQAPWVRPELADVLDQMVHHDFTQRYRSVQEVQVALAVLPQVTPLTDHTDISDSFTAAMNLPTISSTPDEEIEGTTVVLPEDWINQ